jgi:hypothetical protein
MYPEAEERAMGSDTGKQLIRDYIEAVDTNDSSDWSVIDRYVAEDFVATIPRCPVSASTATA